MDLERTEVGEMVELTPSSTVPRVPPLGDEPRQRLSRWRDGALPGPRDDASLCVNSATFVVDGRLTAACGAN